MSDYFPGACNRHSNARCARVEDGGITHFARSPGSISQLTLPPDEQTALPRRAQVQRWPRTRICTEIRVRTGLQAIVTKDESILRACLQACGYPCRPGELCKCFRRSLPHDIWCHVQPLCESRLRNEGQDTIADESLQPL